MPNRDDYIHEVVEQLTDYLDENMPDFTTPLTVTLNHWKYPTQLVITFKEEVNEELDNNVVVDDI
jgi:hypothetical protein